MDVFQCIAQVFKEDCEVKLKVLIDVNKVVKSSDTVGKALRSLFIDPVIYPEGYDMVMSIPSDMYRFKNCIDLTEVFPNNIFK